MLDHEIHMEPSWQTAWLERTLPQLECYTEMFAYAIAIAIGFLNIRCFLTIRRASKQLSEDASRRAEIIATSDKKMKKLTQGHLLVSISVLVHVFVISVVDGVIMGFALAHDAKAEPEIWTRQLILEAALYSAWLFVIFFTTFLLVPLLQILLATHLLARASRNRGFTLANRIPEAAFFTTVFAQLWCMAALFAVVCWSPVMSHSFARQVILQACFGSATTWLNASFTLIYNPDRLTDAHCDLQDETIVFGRTLKAVYGKANRSETLPRYEDIPASDTKVTDEKVGL